MDSNLKLAIVQALAAERLIPAPDYRAIRAANPYDEDTGEFGFLDPGADDYAERFQDMCGYDHLNTGAVIDLETIADDAVALWPRITRLDWSAGEDIQFCCFEHWDGEDDAFDVSSLAGIGALTGLRELSFQSLLTAADLEPLTGLPSLETLDVDTRVADWSPLLRIPTLRSVRAPLDDATAQLLAARGIEVKRR